MPLIQTAEDRAKKKTAVKVVVFGPSGIGKTSLVWSLDPEKTLVVDMEAGMLALEGWQGDSIDVREDAQKMKIHPWIFLKNLACLIAGPNPAVIDEGQFFSMSHYQACVQAFGEREEVLGKYDTIFFDSITQAGRWSMGWSGTQDEALTKDGKKDTRGQYGLHGQQMVGDTGLLTHLQHCPDKNIVLVGILDKKVDDYGRTIWVPQIEGGKTGSQLPGIVDEVISMVEMEAQDGTKFRAFVAHTINQWGYPAKDRSGRLDMIEEPHLGKLIEKMRAGSRNTNMVTTMPEGGPANPTSTAAADQVQSPDAEQQSEDNAQQTDLEEAIANSPAQPQYQVPQQPA